MGFISLSFWCIGGTYAAHHCGERGKEIEDINSLQVESDLIKVRKKKYLQSWLA